MRKSIVEESPQRTFISEDVTTVNRLSVFQEKPGRASTNWDKFVCGNRTQERGEVSVRMEREREAVSGIGEDVCAHTVRVGCLDVAASRWTKFSMFTR